MTLFVLKLKVEHHSKSKPQKYQRQKLIAKFTQFYPASPYDDAAKSSKLYSTRIAKIMKPVKS